MFNKKKKSFKKAAEEMISTELKITSKSGQDGVDVSFKGTKIGILYKITLIISELIKLDLLNFEELSYITDLVQKASKTEEFKRDKQLLKEKQIVENNLLKLAKEHNIKLKAIEIPEDKAKEFDTFLKNLTSKNSELNDIEEFFKHLKED